MTETPKNPKSSKQKNTKDSKDSTEAATAAPRQRRILRSRDERMFAGVAGGLAQYLGIDPTLVRLGFALATLLGGFGLLAYVVMAVLVPEDDGSGNAVPTTRPPIWALVLLAIVLIALPGPLWGFGDHWWGFIAPLWLIALLGAGVAAFRAVTGHWPGQGGDGGASGGGQSAPAAKSGAAAETATVEMRRGGSAWPRIWRVVALLALVMLIIAGGTALALAGAWATATGHGSAVAGTVIALGVALAATAFFAEAARRSAPWLLAIALLLAAPAGAVAAADIRFDGAIGEREYTPTSAQDVRAEGYELGVGRLVVDLRQVDFAPGEPLSLSTDLGVGQSVVSVPEDVCVVGEADAKAGELLVRGDSTAGVDPEFDRGESVAPTVRMLVLDAHLEAGQLVVTDEDPDAFDGDGPGHRDGGDDAGEAAANAEACAAG
jgi:phage shock protein PspC (stress-responsive transcriptional regulator)